MADLNLAFNSHSSIPERSLNGGLYTGEPFEANAPWANVPVIPDGVYMTHFNLRSANPPKDALFQYVGTNRPGNNDLLMHGIRESKGPYNLHVIEGDDKINDASAPKMSKYAYL